MGVDYPKRKRQEVKMGVDYQNGNEGQIYYPKVIGGQPERKKKKDDYVAATFAEKPYWFKEFQTHFMEKVVQHIRYFRYRTKQVSDIGGQIVVHQATSRGF